jgi:hypothetical protein
VVKSSEGGPNPEVSTFPGLRSILSTAYTFTMSSGMVLAAQRGQIRMAVSTDELFE